MRSSNQWVNHEHPLDSGHVVFQHDTATPSAHKTDRETVRDDDALRSLSGSLNRQSSLSDIDDRWARAANEVLVFEKLGMLDRKHVESTGWEYVSAMSYAIESLSTGAKESFTSPSYPGAPKSYVMDQFGLAYELTPPANARTMSWDAKVAWADDMALRACLAFRDGWEASSGRSLAAQVGGFFGKASSYASEDTRSNAMGALAASQLATAALLRRDECGWEKLCDPDEGKRKIRYLTLQLAGPPLAQNPARASRGAFWASEDLPASADAQIADRLRYTDEILVDYRGGDIPIGEDVPIYHANWASEMTAKDGSGSLSIAVTHDPGQNLSAPTQIEIPAREPAAQTQPHTQTPRPNQPYRAIGAYRQNVQWKRLCLRDYARHHGFELRETSANGTYTFSCPGNFLDGARRFVNAHWSRYTWKQPSFSLF